MTKNYFIKMKINNFKLSLLAVLMAVSSQAQTPEQRQEIIKDYNDGMNQAIYVTNKLVEALT
jgi:hypothetical protein